MSILNWLRDDDRAARQWVIKLGILAVFLSCCYMAYAAWHGEGESNEIAMMCAECGYVRERALSLGETIPMTCPKCGKPALYPAFQCTQCGAANIWNEYIGKKPPTCCVKCGKKHYHGE